VSTATAGSADEIGASDEIYVARQPILGLNQELHAYELLYRSSRENVFDGSDATTATSRLVTNSLLTIGLEHLVGEKRAFVNFGRKLLVDGYAQLLPKGAVVIEILEDIEPDAEVLRACEDLKRKGYTLALDDFVSADGYEDLLQLADIVKVDLRLATVEQQRELINRVSSLSLGLLAEKVETHEEFAAAAELGYTMFQGYFFSRPQIVPGRQIPGFKLNYMRILKEVSNPELDFSRIEQVVKSEASLVHKLLRYVNSASFGWKRDVESIRHALALLGETEIRKWISLATVAGIASDKPQQLVIDAVMRGRFCESLSRTLGLAARSSDYFLAGMYSLLDALLDQPMSEVVEEVHLAGDVREVLLGKPAATRGLGEALALARAYERADWDAIDAVAGSLGLGLQEIAQSYLEATEWADQVFKS